MIKFIAVFGLLVSCSETQDIRPVFALFHSFELEGSEPIWMARAKVTVDALTHNPSNRTASKAMISIESNQLTPEERRKVDNLALSGKRYQLKAVDTSTGHHVIAYTYHADPLQQTLKLSLDPSGFLEGVTFLPAGREQVIVDIMQLAPQPETATYIQRMDHERREREKTQGQDNRNFFAKYWMYIVPLVIFLLISGAGNPEGQ
ncbi:ER membrane protein complex subunit 10 [Galendromus occidentalis]|uniref:ER membrane protein complex subunit 10 n=1 Tax=Galendromus occidentalis TaxID=34638 RepID=A0AAJ6QRN0_9ACAR|nr:ER membrane protein complex subunit 10 [Galendromus occidentalis]